MLPPALYKLIGLQMRAFFRRAFRGGKSPGRILVFALGALIVVLWLALAFQTTMRGHRSDPNRVRLMMPLGLLAICVVTAVTSAGDKAIAFTPGEVDQLFPGPFTRRQLLGYKLLKSTLAAVLTALVMSIVLLKHARWWPACFVGVFCSLLFVQFFSIVLLLAGQAIGASAYNRARRFILIGAGILIFVGVRPWIAAGLHGGETAAVQFSASPVGRFLLAPFEPFGQLMTATRGVEILKWSIYAAILNSGLLMLVFMLDGFYVETAMAASERRYAKIQRVRTGSFLSVGVSKTATWQLPQLPWTGGAGPIAWRQLTNAGRSSRGLLLLLAIVAVGAAPALSMAGSGPQALQILLGVLCWLTFLCASMLNFDFRGDIDHIETLKALPVRENAVAVGQLLVPVLLLSAFHALLLSAAAAAIPSHRKFLLAGITIALPFNAILFGAENLIFLLFPSRPAAVSPGDFQVLGRKFIFMLGKMLIVATGVTIAAIFGAFAWGLSGNRLAPATAVVGFILAAEAVGMVPLIARAYRRFDPSIHTPA